ncbi:MAG: hypothetical protein K6B43_05855 [Treponema sp.]|nr:hypothetical protein [Treponema sp.]
MKKVNVLLKASLLFCCLFVLIGFLSCGQEEDSTEEIVANNTSQSKNDENDEIVINNTNQSENCDDDEIVINNTNQSENCDDDEIVINNTSQSEPDSDDEIVDEEKETLPAPPKAVSFTGRASKYTWTNGKTSTHRWTNNPNYRTGTSGKIVITIAAQDEPYFDHYEINGPDGEKTTTDRTITYLSLALGRSYTITICAVDTYGQKSAVTTKTFTTPRK